MAAPTYVATETGSAGTDPDVNLTPGLPAGLLANDLMVPQVSARSVTATVATPAGWTPAWPGSSE